MHGGRRVFADRYVVGVLAVAAVLLSSLAISSASPTVDRVPPALMGNPFPGGRMPDAVPPAVAFQPTVTVGGVLAVFPETGGDPAVGQPLPAMLGYDADGHRAVIHDPSHPRRALLVFVAPWSPDSPDLLEAVSQLPSNARVSEPPEVIVIVTGSRANLPHFPPTRWLADIKWSDPVVLDDAQESFGRTAGLSGFPFVVLLNGDGLVVWRSVGPATIADLQRGLLRSEG